MNYFVYYITAFICIAAFLIVSIWVFPKKSDKFQNLTLKIVSAFLGIVLFVRYLSGKDACNSIIKLSGSPIPNTGLTVVSLLLVWGMYASIFLLVLFPFFKIDFTKKLIKFFVFPISIINFILLVFPIQLITSTSAISFRGILMAIELGITLAYCVYIWVKDHSYKFTIKEFGIFMLCVFGILVASMPSYIPQSFLGYANSRFEVTDFSQVHRIFIYFSLIIPILIWFALHKRSKEVIKFSLLYLSLLTLFTFMASFKFDAILNPVNWPLHLCHTAMYIVPICIVFKWEKLFYFTFFINVLGAFLAMIMPNTTSNMFSNSIMHFWLNHYCAFFMPLLCVALKIYDRPKLKQFIYSSAAFTVYFVFIIFVNAWFSNYGSVDYFFLNSDFIADKLGTWAENLRNVTWTFYLGNLKFVLYPLYQFLFYIVYILAALGMWFLYEQTYLAFDLWTDMSHRFKKIKLDTIAKQSMIAGGTTLKDPINPQNKNKLILKNFTKRYGTSSVYAVKDACLEINGGEIFGFLGPNGAGKSTIIKSIVGIQPITEGSIEACGYDLESQSVEAKKNIGFVPDHYALYEKLTGREYINYIADLYEVNGKERTERIEKYVNIFELTGAFDNQMKTYSHGMKQKIAIMAALVHNPKIWILDEPLTGLDPSSIFQVKECMKQHAKAGNIVFFSSHIIDVVERICTKIAIIKKGQIQCVKTLKEIEKSGTPLETFYLNVINKKIDSVKVKASDRKLDNINKKDKENSFKTLLKSIRHKNVKNKNKPENKEEIILPKTLKTIKKEVEPKIDTTNKKTGDN